MMATTAPGMLRLLSLGAGIQSTTLLLMSLAGALPRLDAAIFTDTGWEPKAVYQHWDRLGAAAAAGGVPVYRVSAGNLRSDALDPDHRFAPLALYVRRQDGGRGMIRRQCTREYKLTSIRRKVRHVYEHAGRPPVEQWLGISADETDRMRDSDVRYITLRYVLVKLGLTGADCQRWLAAHGWPDVLRSSCVGCVIWNLAKLACSAMETITWDRFPLLAGDAHARRWLQFTANIGRAANTIDAYGRAVEDHLRFCALVGADRSWKHPHGAAAARNLVLAEVDRRQLAYWARAEDAWLGLASDPRPAASNARFQLVALGYLLGGHYRLQSPSRRRPPAPPGRRGVRPRRDRARTGRGSRHAAGLAGLPAGHVVGGHQCHRRPAVGMRQPTLGGHH